VSVAKFLRGLLVSLILLGGASSFGTFADDLSSRENATRSTPTSLPDSGATEGLPKSTVDLVQTLAQSVSAVLTLAIVLYNFFSDS